MKELLSAFGSDVFRLLVTTVLPGAIAITPGYVAVVLASTELSNTIGDNRLETAAVLTMAAVLVGLICADISSHLEDLWDKKMPAAHEANWYLYLRQAYGVEPVGQRYIRTLTMHLKFELGSSVGSALAIIGVWWLPLSYSWRGFGSLVLALLAWYLAYEGRCSHEVLSKVRAEMLKGIDVIAAPVIDTPMNLNSSQRIARTHLVRAF